MRPSWTRLFSISTESFDLSREWVDMDGIFGKEWAPTSAYSMMLLFA